MVRKMSKWCSFLDTEQHKSFEIAVRNHIYFRNTSAIPIYYDLLIIINVHISFARQLRQAFRL